MLSDLMTSTLADVMLDVWVGFAGMSGEECNGNIGQ